VTWTGTPGESEWWPHSDAACSGLRARELRCLKTASLDVRRGGLHLDAVWTENRKPGFQPLPRALVATLKAFADSGAAARLHRETCRRSDLTLDVPDDPLLHVPSHPARDLEVDLKAAGIPKWGPGGKVDFHAFRTAYTTMVIESGALGKGSAGLGAAFDA